MMSLEKQFRFAAYSSLIHFSPAFFEEGGMKRVHGTNDRLAAKTYPTSLRFFYRLIRNSDDLQ